MTRNPVMLACGALLLIACGGAQQSGASSDERLESPPPQMGETPPSEQAPTSDFDAFQRPDPTPSSPKLKP